MRTKTKASFPRLTRRGGPRGGTVATLALGQAPGDVVFAGAQIGLYRSGGEAGTDLERWERLPEAPVGIISVAVSPGFAADRTLVVGTNSGIFLSSDAGDNWRAAAMPITGAAPVSICFSANYDR